MERLTERNAYWIGEEFWISAKEPDDEEIDAIYEKLKEYEDLEEQGLLLRLPCRVGDAVWGIENFKCDGTLRNPPQITETKFNHYLLDFVGKTVFLTRAEAEKALEEMGV